MSFQIVRFVGLLYLPATVPPILHSAGLSFPLSRFPVGRGYYENGPPTPHVPVREYFRVAITMYEYDRKRFSAFE